MWNYYKTVVINSAKAEDGHDMFFKGDVVRGTELVKDGAVNVWRNGQYDIEKVGKITKEQLKKIAETKMPDLNAYDVEQAMKIVEGTARNMGIKVEE